MTKLNRQNASTPQTRPVKVLQFGEGNFLRAFADWIIDILNEKTSFNGAVQIVQPLKNGTGHLINEQDGLYHVILNGIQQGKAVKEARLITSVDGVINPYDDYPAFLKKAENPDLQFVISNTTEAGIYFNESDSTPGPVSDSFVGKLTALLYHRFKFFAGSADKGLILLPCELIDKNGTALHQTIHKFIDHWNLPQSFAEWIDKHNIFCNTLVDRIVPGFPKENISEIQKDLGWHDNLVVMAETFHLWVIEPTHSVDHVRKAFPVEQADLQVKFVADLTPYRTRKVRILNGAHTAMVPIAYLNGLRTVQESIENPETGEVIRKIILEEIIPTLDLPASELKQFASDVIERFQNPFIRHELASIALNSISKFKVRVLPSILEYKKRNGKLPELLVSSLAKLICFYKGNWKGETTPVNDSPEVVAFFQDRWSANQTENLIHDVLSNTAFWDMDLTDVEELEERINHHVKQALDLVIL